MRIVQLITSDELRGAEVFAAALSRRLAQRGHRVKLVALYRAGQPRCSSQPAPIYTAEGDTNTEAVRHQATQPAGSPIAGPLAAGPLADAHPAAAIALDGRRRGRVEWRLLRRLIALLRSEAPDVVQANAFHALKLAVLARRLTRGRWPIVYRNVSTASRWIRSRWRRRWGSWLLRQTAAIATVSDSCGRDLCEAYGVDSSRIVTIHRGVAIPSNGAPPAARRMLEQAIGGIETSARIVMHVGGFTAEKNHRGLIEAFSLMKRRIPAAHLVLVGDGPLRGEIEALVDGAGLSPHVHFLGWRRDAAELLSAAEVCLLTSHVEGVPGVVLEAAARGVPCVATDVGGIRDVILSGRTGLLVPPGQMAALARSAVSLLGDDALRVRLGESARRLVERDFSLERCVDAFESLYQRCLQDNGRLGNPNVRNDLDESRPIGCHTE